MTDPDRLKAQQGDAAELLDAASSFRPNAGAKRAFLDALEVGGIAGVVALGAAQAAAGGAAVGGGAAAGASSAGAAAGAGGASASAAGTGAVVLGTTASGVLGFKALALAGMVAASGGGLAWSVMSESKDDVESASLQAAPRARGLASSRSKMAPAEGKPLSPLQPQGAVQDESKEAMTSAEKPTEKQEAAQSPSKELRSRAQTQVVAQGAPKRAEAKPTQVGGLREEMNALRDAKRLLHAGQASAARRALQQHIENYPSSALGPEREVLYIESLAASGQSELARRRATNFVKLHPQSLLSERLRPLLGTAAAPLPKAKEQSSSSTRKVAP